MGINCKPSAKVPNNWIVSHDHFLLNLSTNEPSGQETTKPTKKHNSGNALSFEHLRSNLSTIFSCQETLNVGSFEQFGRRLVKTPWKDCTKLKATCNSEEVFSYKVWLRIHNFFHEVDIAAVKSITNQPEIFCSKVGKCVWKYSLFICIPVAIRYYSETLLRIKLLHCNDPHQSQRYLGTKLL